MRFPKFAVLTATMVFGAAPALALAAGSSGQAAGQPETTPVGPPSTTPVGPPKSTPPTNQGTERKPSTPGPKASLPEKAKAYGKYCQGQSKAHVSGTPGTAFSKCVTDMAKLASGSSTSPRTACKNESKKHVAGKHGTPYSLCVSGAAKLLKNEHTS